jgi:hypothetical protein
MPLNEISHVYYLTLMAELLSFSNRLAHRSLTAAAVAGPQA